MSYQELILQDEEFTYSSNIQFDLENDRKLGGFIPNKAMLSLLREFFVDIVREKSESHARILYGSYGTGKSHFLTVLAQLLGKEKLNGEGYSFFLKRIFDYDPHLAHDIEAFVKAEERRPFFIVPIGADYDDFDRCIYFSLQRALERAQIRMEFKTFYVQAYALLERWEASGESRERLERACEIHETEIGRLKEALSFMEEGSSELFRRIFSEVTFGADFLYETINITEVLEQVNQRLTGTYSGIVFIFDEFGRYIEDSIKNIQILSVQRIAEYCDHTRWNNHIILVSHHEIAQYTKGYGEFVRDEWKKVEGRYQSFSLNDKDKQCLTLLKHILIKREPAWTEFRKQYQRQLNQIALDVLDFKGYLAEDPEQENFAEACFPLHPVSLYALDKLSRRVAQNERTFFTYLAGQGEHSLRQFLSMHEKSSFHFVGLDEIYDYFEPSIRSVQSDAVYEWYRKLQAALAKTENAAEAKSIEVRVLKGIALIHILQEADVLAADKKTLRSVIDAKADEIDRTLDSLCSRRVLKFFGIYNRYDFYDTSIFDLDALIAEETAYVNDEAMLQIMNEQLVDFVLYPQRYNRDYRISRVLIPVFTTVEEAKTSSFSASLPSVYDGLILMVMGDSDTAEEETAMLSCRIPRSIVCCSRSCQELREGVKRYAALHYLELNQERYVKQDPTFAGELKFCRENLEAEIHALMHAFRTKLDPDILIFVNGEKQRIQNEEEMSECASALMYRHFSETLIVNNELLNKNTITSSMMTAKRNAVRSLLRGEEPENYYGLSFLSPEYISVRSVLGKNGFYRAAGELEENCLLDGRMPQRQVEELLNQMVRKAKEGAISAETLLTSLKNPPFGLREGYLSLLLAYWLAPYQDSLLISSHGTEQELTAELFEELVKRPRDFEVSICFWSSEQQDYLEQLEELFSPYLHEELVRKNRLKGIYEAMLLHYKSISRFSRVTEQYLSEPSKKYRSLLDKSCTNYSTFLFERMRTLADDYVSLSEMIRNVKEELDRFDEKLEGYMEAEVRSAFGLPGEGSLAKALLELYENGWKQKRTKAFDYYTNVVLELIGKLSGKEGRKEILSQMSKGLTGFEISYWNDGQQREFTDRLQEVYEKLEQYRASEVLQENESRLVLTSPDGKEYSLVVEQAELSELGRVMKNKMDATLQNFGQAVSYEEKLSVLLSLLKDMVHADER